MNRERIEHIIFIILSIFLICVGLYYLLKLNDYSFGLFLIIVGSFDLGVWFGDFLDVF